MSNYHGTHVSMKQMLAEARESWFSNFRAGEASLKPETVEGFGWDLETFTREWVRNVYGVRLD